MALVQKEATAIKYIPKKHAPGLTKRYLPASITQIDYAAFNGYDQLADIYYGTQEQWAAIDIDNSRKTQQANCSQIRDIDHP